MVTILDLQKIISADDFYKMFIIEGLSYEEIGLKYNASARQIAKLNHRYFKLKQDSSTIAKHRKNTFAKRYNGATCARQIPEIQQKIVNNYKEKYGVENPSQNKDVQEKRKSTFIKKYGVENPFASEEVKDKIKKHYSDLYGDNITNPSHVKEIVDKRSNLIKFAKAKKMNRTKEQVEIASTADNFKKFILSLSEPDRNIQKIAELLSYDETAIGTFIKKYNVENLINFHRSTSSYEEEIYNYLKSLGICNIERNSKAYLNGYEIDIYVPDFKLGIEINGNYWHSEIFKSNNYHQKKSLLALENGIFIYHIFEYELEDTQLKNKIFSQLKILCGKVSRRISARKCSIVELKPAIKKEFLNTYHIQGNTSSHYNYGLMYNDELVSVMCFSQLRFTNGDVYELSRFCTKTDTIVIGGAEKLFKYFLNNVKTPKIISYSDITKAKGSLYEKLGFSKKCITKPDYIWWKSHSGIKSRYQARQKNEITEMHKAGYIRIFNSGHITWEYFVK